MAHRFADEWAAELDAVVGRLDYLFDVMQGEGGQVAAASFVVQSKALAGAAAEMLRREV